ncbi:MAG: pentapeptide repeat-containing protein, partial [Maricaulaceae bacterium]
MSLSPKLRRKLEGLARLCDAPEGSGFRALAEASGLDPKTDFRGLDLSGVDLRDQDLRHIDFTDANFGGAFVAGGQFNATARLETAADAPIRQLTENEVRDMVLRGETPDPRACETIVRINLSGTKIADLNPLKTLANLRLLDLYRTKVANLGPLKTLANLQRLHLEGTPVAELAPRTDVAAWWRQVSPLFVKSLAGNQALEGTIDDDLPPVRVAPHRLTQAVLNLVINASEAMPDGGVIRLRAR